MLDLWIYKFIIFVVRADPIPIDFTVADRAKHAIALAYARGIGVLAALNAFKVQPWMIRTTPKLAICPIRLALHIFWWFC